MRKVGRLRDAGFRGRRGAQHSPSRMDVRGTEWPSAPVRNQLRPTGAPAFEKALAPPRMRPMPGWFRRLTIPTTEQGPRNRRLRASQVLPLPQ